jgi:hypothetical protein
MIHASAAPRTKAYKAQPLSLDVRLKKGLVPHHITTFRLKETNTSLTSIRKKLHLRSIIAMRVLYPDSPSADVFIDVSS